MQMYIQKLSMYEKEISVLEDKNRILAEESMAVRGRNGVMERMVSIMAEGEEGVGIGYMNYER